MLKIKLKTVMEQKNVSCLDPLRNATTKSSLQSPKRVMDVSYEVLGCTLSLMVNTGR